MAIWYAKDRMQSGPAFGSKDFFQGLAVILDTYSNHNGPHNVQYLLLLGSNPPRQSDERWPELCDRQIEI